MSFNYAAICPTGSYTIGKPITHSRENSAMKVPMLRLCSGNIRNRSLGVQFHRQVPLDKFIVDFYCHELKLAIEIDGITHEGDEAIQRDEVRQKRLEDLGVVFIRLFDNDVKVNTQGCFIALQAKVDELLVEKRSQYSKRTSP